MGAWGEGPFDNDDAGDLAASMMRRIDPALDRRKDADASYHYANARAAAQFVMLAHGTDILGGPSIDKVVDLLVRMRTDQEWLASWREPKRVARALDEELLEVLGKMLACKGCKKSHDRQAWATLRDRITVARESPVPKPRRNRLPIRITAGRLKRRSGKKRPHIRVRKKKAPR